MTTNNDFRERLLESLTDAYTTERSRGRVTFTRKTMKRRGLTVAAIVLVGTVGTVSLMTIETAKDNAPVARPIDVGNGHAVMAASTQAFGNTSHLILRATGIRYSGPNETGVATKSEASWNLGGVGSGATVYDSKGSMTQRWGTVLQGGKRFYRAVNYEARTVIERYIASDDRFQDFPVDAPGVISLGEETLNGRQTIHVYDFNLGRPEGEDSPQDATADTRFRRDVWIDKRTYLPVRIMFNTPDDSSVTDYEWTERTDEAVAAMLPSAPSDFRLQSEGLTATSTTLVQ